MGNSAKSHIGWLVMLLVAMAWCSSASCHFQAVSLMTSYIYMCVSHPILGAGGEGDLLLCLKNLSHFLLKLFKHDEGVSTAVDAFNYLSCK